MKAIIATRYGPPEVLALAEVSKPIPKDHEVLVRIHAATVNAGDCEMRRFDLPLLFWLPLRLYMGIRKPRIKILGQELAGEVEAVGNAVQKFQKGDPIVAPTAMNMGAHAEYSCLPADSAMTTIPNNMTYEEAATLPVGGLNALYFLRKAQVQPGEKVLINGAGGCIGTYAVQLAKIWGAEVTAVDSTGKLELLRSIGADQVIDYTQEDFTQSGQTYDVILDIAAKRFSSRRLRALKPNGRYILVNFRLSFLFRGLWISLISDKKVITGATVYQTEDLNFLKDLVESGKLRSVIDRTYPLEQTAEAHRYVETGQKKGNVVITIISPNP